MCHAGLSEAGSVKLSPRFCFELTTPLSSSKEIGAIVPRQSRQPMSSSVSCPVLSLHEKELLEKDAS